MGKRLQWAGALTAAMLATLPGRAAATTFEVGPGKTYANVGDVPLESLTAGDTVLIYYRTTPYKEKFVVAGSARPARRSRSVASWARTESARSWTATAPPPAPSSTTRAACAA
jgi:hypothetical protein